VYDFESWLYFTRFPGQSKESGGSYSNSDFTTKDTKIFSFLFLATKVYKNNIVSHEIIFLPPAARGAFFEKTAPLDPPQKRLVHFIVSG
jgi:hypothetical protein